MNQEAYGNLITNPDLQFFPYGVYIEELGQWHQATFFYESALNTLLLIVMLLALIYPLLIAPYAQIAWSEIAVVFLGYYLLDAAMVSVGVLLSSLCTNQITAAILTLGVNVLMYLSEHYIVPQAGTSAYLHPVSVILGFLPSSSRLGDFANGIISLSDIVYFVAFIALMLFLTDRAMEKRRHAKG